MYAPNKSTLKKLGFSFEKDAMYSYKDKIEYDEWNKRIWEWAFRISYIPNAKSDPCWAIVNELIDDTIPLTINSLQDLENLLQLFGSK